MHRGDRSIEGGVEQRTLVQWQRARMSLQQLRRTIELERMALHGGAQGSRAAADAISPRNESRFPDELAALRAYARAAMKLSGGSVSLWPQVERAGVQRLRVNGALHFEAEAFIRCRLTRKFEPSMPRELEDYVDVGFRLRDIAPAHLQLLVAYYVFGCKAKELAGEYGTCVSALGGRLSQARRALRCALQELLPSPDRAMAARLGEAALASAIREAAVNDAAEQRRLKVARLLRRRLATGEQPDSGCENAQ